jgi:hypothetical protein
VLRRGHNSRLREGLRAARADTFKGARLKGSFTFRVFLRGSAIWTGYLQSIQAVDPDFASMDPVWGRYGFGMAKSMVELPHTPPRNGLKSAA